MALEKLKIPHTSTFTVEIAKHMQEHIKANFTTQKLLDDVCCKEFVELPTTDLLTGGFPCQPFSSIGKNKGRDDQRGRVIQWVIKHIKKRLPRCFLLENVEGLVKRHSKFFNWLLEQINSIKDSNGKKAYTVHWQILNSNDFRLPQHRRRVYIVGTLNKYVQSPFTWPAPLGKRKLTAILGKPSARKVLPSAAGSRRRLQQMEKVIRTKHGVHPSKLPMVIDIAGSKSSCRLNEFPCITATRGGQFGYWITCLRRQVNLEELIRAQGMHPKRITQVISDNQLGKAVGNAWSQPVIEEILKKLLPSVGLTPEFA